MSIPFIPQISVWTPKGGVGKTIVSLNLAAAFAAMGRRVMLLDHDPQGGSLIFGNLAQNRSIPLPFSIGRVAPSKGFDLVIYDHAPALPDSVVPGDIVVMPTLLDASSYLLFVKGSTVVHNEWRKPFVDVPNRFNPSRKAQADVLNRYHKDKPVLRDRAVYGHAYGKGMTIYDKAGLSGLHAARAEFDCVVERVVRAVQTVYESRQPRAA